MDNPGPDHDRGDLGRRLRERARAEGFEAAGIARLKPSDHGRLLRAWLAAGRHGSMRYLERSDAVAARVDPRSRWPELRSALVVAHHYGPGSAPGGQDDHGSEVEPGPGAGHPPDGDTPPGGAPAAGDRAGGADRGVIARYARGRDYHRVVRPRLLRILDWLEAELDRPLPAARAYVDTGPVLERELARRAGLGWFGRNTMLIDPGRGSYFFLGVLLLPLELAPDPPFTADRCGSCRACLDACPTGALLGRDDDGAPIMDATRCISYLTIENRGAIPEELRPSMGNRVYGCDICQEVCPWNSPKLVPATTETDYLARVPGLSGETEPSSSEPYSGTGAHPHPHAHSGPATDSPSLVELMRMSREEWDAWTRGSAIRRAGYAGFKRNVAVAMGNWLASVDEPPEEAVAVLRKTLADADPLVREHGAWALGRSGARTGESVRSRIGET